MSQASRLLKVGDRVTTDLDPTMLGSEHIITGRKVDSFYDGKIWFQVSPPLRGLKADKWIEAYWFEPLEKSRASG